MPALPTRVASSWSPGGGGGGGGGGVTVHNLLSGRGALNAHPIAAITGLVQALLDLDGVDGDLATALGLEATARGNADTALAGAPYIVSALSGVLTNEMTLGAVILPPDVIADRPAANTVPAGALYFSADEAAFYRSTGAAWVDITAPLMADVASQVAAVQAQIGALPNAAASTDIIPDAVSSPGDLLWKLGLEVGRYNDLTLRLSSQVRLAAARCTTVQALPACTYANGAAGEGATLTGNANGAVPITTTDQCVLAAGNWLLVKTQAAPLQNGLYEVTQVGDAGTPFILTRVPCADEAADFLAGVEVHVGEGLANQGRAYVAQDVVVMGTTAVVWRQSGASTMTQARMRQTPQQLSYFSDFTELDAALAPNAAHQRIPGTEFTVNIPAAATAAAATQAAAAGSPGIIAMATGTLATGHVACYAGLVAFTFATASEALFGARVIIPTLSVAGVQAFVCRVGLFDSVTATAPANGIYFEAPADGSNWLAICRVGGVQTGSAIDTGQAQGTTAKTLAIIYDPLTLTAFFYMSSAAGMVLVASIANTNLPTGASLLAAAAITKSVGTTARTLQVDNLAAVIPDTRSNQYLLP